MVILILGMGRVLTRELSLSSLVKNLPDGIFTLAWYLSTSPEVYRTPSSDLEQKPVIVSMFVY